MQLHPCTCLLAIHSKAWLLHADACGISPAKVPGAITVAATDSADGRWAYSNYGACVDVYAPGVQVRSAMFYTKTANITASGTSMACPVVSGISALYLQANPAAVPSEVAPSRDADFNQRLYTERFHCIVSKATIDFAGYKTSIPSGICICNSPLRL